MRPVREPLRHEDLDGQAVALQVHRVVVPAVVADLGELPVPGGIPVLGELPVLGGNPVLAVMLRAAVREAALATVADPASTEIAATAVTTARLIVRFIVRSSLPCRAFRRGITMSRALVQIGSARNRGVPPRRYCIRAPRMRIL